MTTFNNANFGSDFSSRDGGSAGSQGSGSAGAQRETIDLDFEGHLELVWL